MTELENLHRRIYAEDAKTREAVTSDEVRRYLDLRKLQDDKQEERQQILAELHQARDQVALADNAHHRGVGLIARGLRGA